ncbi:MAG: DUF5004 domain-containing protein [Cyclobacteriaceae bacterium]
MKKQKIYYVLFLLLGCTNPVDDLEIGEPFSQQEAVIDDWELRRVHHIDELDLNKPYTDLTELFTASAASLVIDESTFTYTQSSGPNFLDTSGSWEFDDEDFPEYMILNSGTQVRLGAPARSANDSLILVFERKCEEKTVSSYEYLFIRK